MNKAVHSFLVSVVQISLGTDHLRTLPVITFQILKDYQQVFFFFI